MQLISEKILLNKQTPFWLIAVSAMIGLTLPSLIQDGMFMDAMLYTSVSHNLGMGIGTFWFPKFSLHNVGGLSSFHEQPPLVFGIQSIFFKILGSSMYIERLYTFLCMIISATLINQLWKVIYKQEGGLKKMGWLPVILWITVPVCFWSYSNNMHENTMGIFTLTAVIMLYKAILSEKITVLNLVFAGVFIFLATLSKGIPGFFPIIIPFLYWLVTRKKTFSVTMAQTTIILLVPAAAYLLLFLIPESRESLSTYLFKRALHRINEVPTVDSRFWIIGRLFMELLPQLLITAVVLLIARLMKIRMGIRENIPTSLLFIAIGFSASAPLMLTLVQKGFYFVPALPYFATGLSIIVAPAVYNLTKRMDFQGRRYKFLLITSIILLIMSTCYAFMQKGKTLRDQKLLHDVYLIGAVVPIQATVSIDGGMWDNFALQCYLARYYSISLEPVYQKQFYINDNTMHSLVPTGYKKINVGTWRYDLYKQP